MPTAPRLSDPASWLGPRPWATAAAVVAGLTLWRVAALGWSATDLYTDESQYWFWSTDLALGYYSKPPLIAWLIRLSTALGGAETPFWVRLPAPLLHAATAAAVGLLGGKLYGPRLGALAAVVYATLPAVTVGSIVISTDTALLPFAALAGWAWLRLLDRPGDPMRGAALGLIVGAGLYAKYAVLYLPLGMVLAAITARRFRLSVRALRAALGAFLLVALPHLAWSVHTGFVTAGHVVADAQAGAGRIDVKDLLEFLGAQFGVFGPALFAAFLWALARALRGRGAPGDAALLWLSAPVLAIVSVQALRAGAEANWAAIAYAAATPLVATLLAAQAPRLLAASLALHGAVALVLPLATAAPESIRAPNGRPVLARMIGREDLAREIGAVAEAEGAAVIVCDNRGVLSDLLYVLRDRPVAIHAPPPEGPPANHFEMTIPLPPTPEGVTLMVTGAETPPSLPGLTPVAQVATFAPESGFFARRSLRAWRMEPAP